MRFRTADELVAAGADLSTMVAEQNAVQARQDYLCRDTGPDGNLRADARREFDALQTIADGLVSAVNARATVDRTGVVAPSADDRQSRRGPVLRPEQRFTDWARNEHLIPEDHTTAERPMEFGRWVRGMVTGNWQDADLERQAMREGTSVPFSNAMSEGTTTAGGYLVPTILSTQLIDLARNRTRVLEAGAQIVPMKNSTVDLARWAGDPTAAWHTENAAVTATDATLARVRLQAKALMGMVVASRELIEDADPVSIDQALSDAFAAEFARVVDLAALYSTGSGGTPTGVKSTSGVTITPMATNGAALTNWDPLVNAVYTVRAANEDPTAVIWSPRSAKNAALLKDTTNQPLSVPSYLDDVRRLETAQIPNNLTVGSGTTTSDLFAADWRQLLLGVRTDLQIQVLTERFADNGQIGFVAWWRGDIAVTRPAAFAVTTGIL